MVNDRQAKSGVSINFWRHNFIPYIKQKYNNQCQICGSNKNLEGHHLRYDRQTIRDILLLCRICHKIQHNAGCRKSVHTKNKMIKEKE